MENTMKNFMMLLCLVVSPLSFSYGDDTSGDGTNTGNKSSGGGYGSGSGGGAAALLAVGAIVYYMRRGNDDNDPSEFGFVRNIKESKFDISFGDNDYFKDDFTNYSYDLGSSSNKFQLNLTYKFN
jgi:hypothetical protein